MDVTTRRDTLKTTIAAMEKELGALKNQLAMVNDEYQMEVGRLYCGVTIKTRKASYVMVAPNGKSIVMPIQKNAYGERNVYWYEGKQGTLILDHTRWNSNRVAKWLSEQK